MRRRRGRAVDFNASFYAFLLPSMLPLVVQLWIEGGIVPTTMGLLLTLFCGGIAMLARNQNTAVVDAIKLRLEQDALPEERAKRQHALERQFAERTSDLRERNAELRAEIGEHKHTSRELGDSEERIQRAVQARRVTPWEYRFDTGTIEYVSNTSVIVGEILSDMGTTEGWSERTPPEVFAVLIAATQECAQGGQSGIEVEHRLFSKGGAISWFVTRALVVRDRTGRPVALSGTTTGITARECAKNALKESDARYRMLFEQALVMMHSTNREGRLVHFSAAWLDTLGYRQNGMLGEKAAGFMTERSRAHAERVALPQSLEKGQVVDIPYTMTKKNGGTVDVLLSVFALRGAHGEAMRSISVLVDVTERLHAEHSLVAAKDEAESANRAKSEVLADTSHELRTPLNAIIGFADMLDGSYMGALNEKQREYVSHIRDSGLALLELINDILDLSKIETGKARLYEGDNDVARAVKATVRLISGRVVEAELRLNVDVADGLPRVRADERLLKRTLLDLLSNAVKFTTAGGKISVTALVDEDGRFQLTVADMEIGANEDYQVLAMAPFGQVDSSLSRRYRGTGLGLLLVKPMVALHGGDIGLTSEVGASTTVAIHFPMSRVLRSKSVATTEGTGDR